MAKTGGWVHDRGVQEGEPAVRTAITAQEAELRALWEREGPWWKTHRHVQGDSLRKPMTNVRALIGTLPGTPTKSWDHPQTGKREPIGLKVFNLSEGEWVQMNDRSQLTTQERFHHRQLVRDPEAIVHRTLSLFRSDDWADLVVGGDGYWAATHGDPQMRLLGRQVLCRIMTPSLQG